MSAFKVGDEVAIIVDNNVERVSKVVKVRVFKNRTKIVLEDESEWGEEGRPWKSSTWGGFTSYRMRKTQPHDAKCIEHERYVNYALHTIHRVGRTELRRLSIDELKFITSLRSKLARSDK